MDMIPQDMTIGSSSTPQRDRNPKTPMQVEKIAKLATITVVGCVITRRQTKIMHTKVQRED